VEHYWDFINTVGAPKRLQFGRYKPKGPIFTVSLPYRPQRERVKRLQSPVKLRKNRIDLVSLADEETVT